MSILCSMVGASFGTVSAVVEVLRRKTSVIATGVNVSTTQSKFGGSSAFFDGTSTDLLAYRGLSSNPTGDMTLEGWIYLSALPATGDSGYMMFLTTGGNDYVNLYQTNKIQLAVGGRYGTVTTPAIFAINTWYHLAIVRSSGTYKVYWNGTDCGAFTNDASWPPPAPTFDWPGVDAHFGRFTDTRGDWFGYMDELRISKSARYTANFTPSTTPFVNDANTQLLIHADGTHLSTYFEDDNGVRLPKTGIAGVNAQISNLQSKFGNTSFLLNGTTDTRIIVNDSISETGAYTIELWFRKTANAGDLFYVQPETTGRAVMYIAANGDLLYDTYSTGTPDFNNTGSQVATALANNVWYHLAYVREASNTVKIFLDGVLKQTGTSNVNLPTGGVWFGSRGYTGNIDEIRVSNIARYTGSFTPATVPFVNDINTTLLYHADGTDGSIVIRDDNGALPATTTGTAVTFDGTGDYYSATGITTSATDSKYLLFVCTFYWAGGNNLQHLADLRLGTGAGDVGFYSWINGGRSQITLVGGGSEYKTMYEDAENSLTSGAWNQIVFYMQTDSTANSRIYINGVSRAFTNSNQNLTTLNWANTATTITIGQKQAAITGTGDDFNGRMAQIYIHNPASFPGIESFWAGGPRDLGTNGTSTGLAQPLIYHYGNNDTFRTNNGTGFASYTLTANGNAGTATANLPTFYSPRTPKGVAAIGNAQVSTAQSKFGGASSLYDGNGDYLQLANSNDFNFGSGNWTAEFWWYQPSNVAAGIYPTIISFGILNSDTGFLISSEPTTNKVNLISSSDGSGGMGVQATSANISAATWNHIAVVVNSSVATIYVNGTASGVGYSTRPKASTGQMYIGGGLGGLSSGTQSSTSATVVNLNGYLDEIRISKIARYTANFTAPTAPFQNDANTVLLMHMDGTNASTVFVDDNGIAPYTL